MYEYIVDVARGHVNGVTHDGTIVFVSATDPDGEPFLIRMDEQAFDFIVAQVVEDRKEGR